MIHIAMHFAVPLLFALAFYRDRWRHVTLVLIATMLVDLDHLRADPIYDPGRCSIGFHPLHGPIPIAVYGLMFLAPWLRRPFAQSTAARSARKDHVQAIHLLGLGLLIHMALDGIDCWTMSP